MTRLPVRALLAAALVLIAGVPALVTWGVHEAMAHAEARPGPADLENARTFVADGSTRWTDPGWRGGARAYLTSLGVQAEVQPVNGPLIDLTGDGPAPPTAVRDKFIIDDPGNPAVVVGSAWVAASHLTPAPGWGESVVAGAAALLAILAAIAVLLGRTVVRPLAAMSRAAQAIADGDLDVHLPSSPVREVADAMAAIEGMSVRLGSAVDRQAELEQERRLFVSAIAHDLRTPLFTLRAYLDGLRDGLADEPDRARRYLDVCRQKTASLDRLVSDLFSYAQVDLLGQEVDRQPLDVAALLRRCLGDLEPKMAPRLRLDAAGAPVPCLVTGDEHLLGRVVDNLLDNAVRHTADGGRVTVRWRQDGEWVTFEVEDTGPGIAPDDLAHLFEPLYRGEASRNRRTGGAGLGLTIARRIVRAHGGELSAANSAAGRAVFTARLPAAQQSPLPWTSP